MRAETGQPGYRVFLHLLQHPRARSASIRARTHSLTDQAMPDESKSLSADELLAQLSRPRPKFREEDSAPPVDRELLGRLVRCELSDDQTRAVSLLVHSYRSWDEAHTVILVEHYRTTCRKSGDANARGGSPNPDHETQSR